MDRSSSSFALACNSVWSTTRPAENIPINEEGSPINGSCYCYAPVNNNCRDEFCRCRGNSIVKKLGIKYCRLQKTLSIFAKEQTVANIHLTEMATVLLEGFVKYTVKDVTNLEIALTMD